MILKIESLDLDLKYQLFQRILHWCVFFVCVCNVCFLSPYCLMFHLSFIHCTVVGLKEDWAWAFQSFKASFKEFFLCHRHWWRTVGDSHDNGWDFLHFFTNCKTAGNDGVPLLLSTSISIWLSLPISKCLSLVLIICKFIFILLNLNQRAEQMIHFSLYW